MKLVKAATLSTTALSLLIGLNFMTYAAPMERDNKEETFTLTVPLDLPNTGKEEGEKSKLQTLLNDENSDEGIDFYEGCYDMWCEEHHIEWYDEPDNEWIHKQNNNEWIQYFNDEISE